jgi:streptomycin 6-kinase
MNLPATFIQHQITLNGERGLAWVESLPALIGEFEQRWGIKVGAPFGLSYNFAAPATRSGPSNAHEASDAQVVFKAVAPYLDADTEADVLLLYDGRGAIKLLERDQERGVMLLERCLPGTELATLFPDRDDEASAIAGEVMAQLWRPLPAAHPFPTLAEYTSVLDRLYDMFGGTTGPMDKRVADAAISLRRELLVSAPAPVLLHGDLHHHNILMAQRQPWLAIDPKGVAGDPAYEPSPLFYNPVGEWHAQVDGPRLIQRRVDIISERAGLDRQRVLGWAVVQGIVSDAWTLEDGGVRDWPGPEMTAAWALALM